MLRFGDCTLDTRQHVLYRSDQSIPLPPKDYQMLRYLLEHRDRVIAKQELSAQLWPGQTVRNTALESTMKRVRQATAIPAHSLVIFLLSCQQHELLGG